MKALKIEPNGNLSAVDITGGSIEQQNDCIYRHLGGYFDIVHLPGRAVMLVDDEGLLKGLRLNATAMMLSSYPMIVGTALIVGLRPTEDGDVFTDCPLQYLRFADAVSRK